MTVGHLKKEGIAVPVRFGTVIGSSGSHQLIRDTGQGRSQGLGPSQG